MRHFYLLTLFLGILALSVPSQGRDWFESTRRRQQQKDAKRWSLSQWLEQKQRIGLMDSWLMYNSPSPYEFFFSVDTASFETTVNPAGTTTSHRSYRGSFGAFVTLVGLYGEYESTDEDVEQWKALFMLRLLGSSDQSTHFTVHYGLMNRDLNGDVTQHQVAGGRMNLYLLRAFALTGLYEHYFKATSEQNFEYEGSRWEAGAHIEYGALRIYGHFFQETMDSLSPLLVEGEIQRKGILFGTRVYF